jgi:hypothetical protein
MVRSRQLVGQQEMREHSPVVRAQAVGLAGRLLYGVFIANDPKCLIARNVDRCNLKLDLRILWMTFASVIRPEGIGAAGARDCFAVPGSNQEASK